MGIQRLQKDIAAAKQLRVCLGRARTHFLELNIGADVDSEVRHRVHGAEWALIMFQNDVANMLREWSAELRAAEAEEAQTQQATGKGTPCQHAYVDTGKGYAKCKYCGDGLPLE